MIRRQTVRRAQAIGGLLCALLLCDATGSQAGTIMVDPAIEQGPMNHRANGYLVSIEPGRQWWTP